MLSISLQSIGSVCKTCKTRSLYHNDELTPADTRPLRISGKELLASGQDKSCGVNWCPNDLVDDEGDLHRIWHAELEAWICRNHNWNDPSELLADRPLQDACARWHTKVVTWMRCLWNEDSHEWLCLNCLKGRLPIPSKPEICRHLVVHETSKVDPSRKFQLLDFLS